MLVTFDEPPNSVKVSFSLQQVLLHLRVWQRALARNVSRREKLTHVPLCVYLRTNCNSSLWSELLKTPIFLLWLSVI